MKRSKLKDTLSKHITPVIVIVAVAIIGSIWVVFTHAQTPTVSLLASDGNTNGCASKVSTSGATNGTAVKFSSCGSFNPISLDETGATIPDTNYTIPSGAIFMSPSGVDTNAGTQAAPVKTINKALSLVASGGTIVMRGGTYRDWSNNNGTTFLPISKVVTIQAYPHEQAWFDGADVVTGWTSDGAGHWYKDWNTPSFCSGGYYNYPYNAQPTANNGPCSHYDMYYAPSGTSTTTAAGDPQMVFINGAQASEVTSLAAATGGNFYYDQTNKRIYISTDPNGKTVELAARPNAMIMTGSGSKILGIGFRHYASNEQNNSTEAAVILSNTNQTAENNVFTLNAGAGLGMSNPVNQHVNHNVFAYNGFDGAEGNGHQHSTGAADNPVIENNLFNHNNNEGFGYNCSASCSQAAIKISHMVGFTFRNNIVNNTTNGQGFWCDLACSNGTMVNNYLSGNGRAGIMYEVSDTGIIASNVTVNNATGIRVAASHTKIYNNTIYKNTSDRDIWVYDDPRQYGVGGWTDVGPDTIDVSIVNNVVESTTPIIVRGEGPNTAQTSPNTAGYFTTIDYNAYNRINTSGQTLWGWIYPGGANYYASATAFNAAHPPFEAHSIDTIGGSDPFFVNAAGGDFTVRSTSTAYHSGTTIPADVMTALGLSSGTGYSRGAISWPH